jgi:dTDP-4-amino-4,6-dideoxygalactose transaminase
MTEMQAALGLQQMSRLEEYVDRRNALADRYDEELSGLALDLPGRLPGSRSAYHLYVVRLRDKEKHRPVFEALRAAGIGVNLHYIPVHLQPYYQTMGFKVGDFPIAEDYYARAISIPLYAIMTDEQQDIVIAHIRELIGR